jgi:hypothetical protein
MYNRNESHWTTRDGEEILIKDLSDSHLTNILNWMQTKHFNEAVPIYPSEFFQFMQHEAEYRKMIAFVNNGALINRQADGWYIVENTEALCA